MKLVFVFKPKVHCAIDMIVVVLQAEDPGELEKLPLIGSLFKKKEQPERLLQLWVTCTLGMLRDGNSKNV